MITCIINGSAAYPAASLSVKITYANQYVTDDGEYSYDIAFPMEIPENRRIFSNISRLDVRKSIAKFDDCKLYASGMMVLSGVGTVLSVSDTEVKLQIVGGKSRIKYNEKLTQHYIDQIDLGKAAEPGVKLTSKEWKSLQWMVEWTDAYFPTSTGQIGEEGKYVFVPTYDETNDRTANYICGKAKRTIGNCAVHVNLNHLLRLVLEYEGYTLKRNDFDTYPWNTLYVASAYRTLEFSKGLPHWTCYTFIDEYRKFFNASIHFDDISKTVTVVKANELSSNSLSAYEPLDEYSVDYDEDGSLNTAETSNLEYNLGSVANRSDYVTIPQAALDYFDIYEIRGYGNGWWDTIESWDLKKKRTTIVKHAYGTEPYTYYIYVEDEDGNEGWQVAGYWNTLVRNEESDNSISLNISPAGLMTWYGYLEMPIGVMSSTKYRRVALSVPNDKEQQAEEYDVDDDGYSYVSVQDAIQDDSVLDNSEDESEPLFVYFLGKKFHDGTDSEPYKLVDTTNGNNMAWPTPVTDWRIYWRCHAENSLTLSLIASSANALGSMHDSLPIDVHNCLEIKFRSRSIPDPSNIFMFRNKRYVCEKIEVEIKDDGIDPIMTGYFYMMQ